MFELAAPPPAAPAEDEEGGSIEADGRCIELDDFVPINPWPPFSGGTAGGGWRWGGTMNGSTAPSPDRFLFLFLPGVSAERIVVDGPALAELAAAPPATPDEVSPPPMLGLVAGRVPGWGRV